MEQNIYVNGKVYSLILYRRFSYKGKPYAIYLHPTKCDAEGDPILYVFAGKDGRYTLPSKEAEPAIIQIVASVLNNETSFDETDDVVWMPWGE